MTAYRQGKYWEELLAHGVTQVPAAGLSAEALGALYSDMWETAESFDPADFPGKGPMNRCISAEEKDGWAAPGTKQQSTSVFLSYPYWTGPFDPEGVGRLEGAVFASLEEHLPGVRGGGHFDYESAPRPTAFGFHHYPPFEAAGDDQPSEGLLAHKDVGVVSVLYTRQPLTVMKDGEPAQVVSEPGHFIVFLGLVGAHIHGARAALHWVDPVPEGKFTMGCFPDPPMDQPASPDTHRTFGYINRLYFSGVADAAELVPRILAGGTDGPELDQ